MFRYAWAYQQATESGERIPYPVQIIAARFLNYVPTARIEKTNTYVSVRGKILMTQTSSGQLYIFNKR